MLAQARSIVPRLAIILSAQLNRLDVLMGAQPGNYAAELSGSADIPVAPAITALADPSDLLRRRPESSPRSKTLPRRMRTSVRRSGVHRVV